MAELSRKEMAILFDVIHQCHEMKESSEFCQELLEKSIMMNLG